MMKALLFVFCVLFSASVARADIAKPQQPPQRTARQVLHTGLEITTDPKAYEAKLQISESDLKNLRASLDGSAGSAPVVGGLAFSSGRTIIAGLLMFMAISIAGVFVARSSSFGRTQKALAAIFLVAVMIGAAAIITRGNAGPPGSWRWRNLPQALAEGKSTVGGLDVEIVPDNEMSGRTMRLIIPLKKQNGSGDE